MVYRRQGRKKKAPGGAYFKGSGDEPYVDMRTTVRFIVTLTGPAAISVT